MKQNVIDDYNLLSGQQKAAILMMSLDEDKSAQIFALMDDEEIKELSVIMASLGNGHSNVVEQLISGVCRKVLQHRHPHRYFREYGTPAFQNAG